MNKKIYMNKEFNKVLKESFISYLKTGERNNDKTKTKRIIWQTI